MKARNRAACSGDLRAAEDQAESAVPLPTRASDDDPDSLSAQLRRRPEASWRLPPVADGYRDPLDRLAAS